MFHYCIYCGLKHTLQFNTLLDVGEIHCNQFK